jgi:hypothetical protein
MLHRLLHHKRQRTHFVCSFTSMLLSLTWLDGTVESLLIKQNGESSGLVPGLVESLRPQLWQRSAYSVASPKLILGT